MDSVESFEKVLERYNESRSLQNHMLDIIENLHKDLEISKNTIDNLQKQNSSLMKMETFPITSKYWSLKKEQETLKEQIELLKNENEDLNIQIIAKTEEIKKLCSNKEEQIKNHCAKQLKQMEDELKTVKDKHEKKEQELYNEIHFAEAASALKLDQIESNLRKQLDESNMKAKEYLNICTILRTELLNIKEEFALYKTQSVQKIADLRRQLQKQEFQSDPVPVTAKQQNQHEPQTNTSNTTLSKYDEKTWDIDIDTEIQTINGTDSVEKANNLSKYQPLEVSCTNNTNRCSTLEDKPEYRKPSVYRGKSLGGNYKNIHRNTVPPLIKLKDVENQNEHKLAGKKRKLFNPDDLTYLHKNIEADDKNETFNS